MGKVLKIVAVLLVVIVFILGQDLKYVVYGFICFMLGGLSFAMYHAGNFMVNEDKKSDDR